MADWVAEKFDTLIVQPLTKFAKWLCRVTLTFSVVVMVIGVVVAIVGSAGATVVLPIIGTVTVWGIGVVIFVIGFIFFVFGLLCRWFEA